mgnify:CR=1 FL=1
MLDKLLPRKAENIKLKILRILLRHEEGLPASKIAENLGKNLKKYSYLFRHLNDLEKAGLIIKMGRRYIVADRQKVMRILDPPRLKLYWAGHDPAPSILAELFGKVPLLLSAGTYWFGGKFSLAAARRDTSVALELFLDSGAQQFYKKFKGRDYPYTERDYLNFALELKANLLATLDLPLDILVPDGRVTISRGIRLTVSHGVKLLNLAERLELEDKIKIVPVLQGFDDPVQWLECLDLYRDHGIDSDIWGVGSLCMARSKKLIYSVLTELRNVLGSSKKLHVFGLSLNALRDVYRVIDSFDTAVWIYWAKKDGAVLAWDPVELSFVHLQARDGKRYDTKRLLRINAIQIYSMLETLNNLTI